MLAYWGWFKNHALKSIVIDFYWKFSLLIIKFVKRQRESHFHAKSREFISQEGYTDKRMFHLLPSPVMKAFVPLSE